LAPKTDAADADADAVVRYQQHLDRIDDEQQRAEASDHRIGIVRVLLFLLVLFLLFLSAFSQAGAVFAALAATAFAAFLGVVIYNEPIRDRLDRLRQEKRVFRRLIARVQRDWDAIEDDGAAGLIDSLDLPAHERDVAVDLDLFGKASLFRLVSVAATHAGIRKLAAWLAGPATDTLARSRFRAAEVLAPEREGRLRFYVLSREIAASTGDPERFARWAGGPTWLQSRSWLVVWANLSALIAVGLFAAFLLSLIGVSDGSWIRLTALGLLFLAIGNVLLSSLVLGPAHEVFSVAMSSRRVVQDYAELFRFGQMLPTDSDTDGLLNEIRRRLVEGDDSAVAGMDALSSVARKGALKQSAATFLLYLPLQCWGLWDVRVMRRLEAWQLRYGTRAADWFDALGELEALMSLAAVHDEQPSWTQPEWVSPRSGDAAVLTATAIGHPLLSDEARVCNDVQVGPPGTVLLVTGSNMSGKSTMLRSIGLNVALAAAGAPACARRLSLPSMEMATSIRVSDNLAEGVSFYMAELHRLKAVVDHARRLQKQDDRVTLYLLDEILQGTNSRERQIAVTQVLSHLRRLGAIGAISTHDLELADEPELQQIATTVHFRETITPDADGNDQMTFDYQMRTGVSPTTNALRLLQIVGLGEADQNEA